MKKYIILIIVCVPYMLGAQQNIIFDFSKLEINKITENNILDINISTTIDKMNCGVSGVIKYRETNATIHVSGDITLHAGTMNMGEEIRNLKIEYSSNSLKELIKYQGQEPYGEMEYCMTISEKKQGGEIEESGQTWEDCMIKTNEPDLLINLLEPEDKSEITEYYPILSWMVNSKVLSDLNYTVRMVELKEGQSKTSAMARNRPIYKESNLMSFSQLYPSTATMLVTDQDYVWTVDAYYKDILLGTAEPFQFRIVEDSLMKAVPKDVSYLDIKKEKNGNGIYALGNLKIKYDNQDYLKDTLEIRIFRDDNEIHLKNNQIPCKVGDNRIIFDLDSYGMKHLKSYVCEILSYASGSKYMFNFIYVNPMYIR